MTRLFERYQRSEKTLVGAMAEMYVQGVSTRKVKAVTEALCGHEFSGSSISQITKRLDEGLAQFAGRRLEEAYPSGRPSSPPSCHCRLHDIGRRRVELDCQGSC